MNPKSPALQAHRNGHASVSTTMPFYVKSAADDILEAMAKLEGNVPLRKSRFPKAQMALGTPTGH
jgi:hypothetical protein